MKSIKIESPKGYEAHFDQKASEIVFKPLSPKPIMERFKTIEDILADHGTTTELFNKSCDNIGLTIDEKNYRLVKMITESFNEGWQVDWNDDNQYKYYPWFYMGGSGGFRFIDYGHWVSASIVGSRLAFKSRELAEYASKQFTQVYKDFMLTQ